jgi:hypothetical protein
MIHNMFFSRKDNALFELWVITAMHK